MEYRKTITLKDGRNCIIRNGLAQDGNAAREVFLRTHGETDYLLTYPDETRMTGEQEAQFLKERTDSPDEVELVAEIDGCLVGTAGIRCRGNSRKNTLKDAQWTWTRSRNWQRLKKCCRSGRNCSSNTARMARFSHI